MSFGNQWTEISLNTNKNSLIVGKNGSGKSSSILDSITFALYGKPYRNINKPQLINSITDKNMLVEIEFEIGKKQYLIRRGIKPAIFEIFVNGEIVKQDSLTKDYQTYLENNILKINYKSFCQIVILGASDYVPFMQLPAHSRRLIIEDLLDLQVFSSMNTILKERINENKEELIAIDHNIKVVQSNITLHENHIKLVETDLKEQYKILKQKIANEVSKSKEAKLEYAKLEKERLKLSKEVNSYDKFVEKLNSVNESCKQLESKKISYNKQKEFYLDSCNCPTCKQEIEDKFKKAILEKCDKTIIQIDKNLSVGYSKIEQLKEKIKQRDLISNQINVIVAEQSSLNQTIYSSELLYNNYVEEQVKLINKVNLQQVEQKVELENNLKSAKEYKRKFNDEKEVLMVASQLLKDGGIKTLVIKQYIPVMNKIINQYLNHMNFFVDFTLDDNFDESIKSRNRDDFSYNSFSEGEKFRINLAILFAWRAIAKMRNTAATNILIFDEIADGSLDNDGTDDFMKILNSLTADTNIFIISHQTDNTSDKFDRILKFEKRKNFSFMETL